LNNLEGLIAEFSWLPQKDVPTALAWMNQLLQKEFVETLYFSVGTASCAIEATETPAKASTINNFFIPILILMLNDIVFTLLSIYCAKVNIYFESANFFGKKLHFFRKKGIFYLFQCSKTP
jgi:hypothetical protein